uniref:Uncharacterized protein TCIL3000_3_2230 n=1 Tax=Trypanosoma congolense (strain IL3000) TaxID=1068625 RepID=G0UK86_TRYCI|nr:unnamed protein product [Trypanosoma congolense IL3000]
MSDYTFTYCRRYGSHFSAKFWLTRTHGYLHKCYMLFENDGSMPSSSCCSDFVLIALPLLPPHFSDPFHIEGFVSWGAIDCCFVGGMLRDKDECYIDYLEGLFRWADVDLSIVRSALASLGFDDHTIDIMMGECLSLCWSSSSSSTTASISGVLSERLYKQGLDKGPRPPEAGTLNRGASLQSRVSAGIESDANYPDTRHFPIDDITSVVSPLSTGSDMYVHQNGLPCYDTGEAESTAVSSQARCVGEIYSGLSSGSEWGSRGYKRHLKALEELLGIFWYSDGKVADDYISLRLRSSFCRLQLEKLVHHGNKPERIVFPVPRCLCGVRHSRPGTPQAVRNDVKHLTRFTDNCSRHFPTLRRRKACLSFRERSPSGGHARCELCTSLAGRFASPHKGRLSTKPQTTSTAPGSTCRVKIRPATVSTLGRGCMRAKATATTLSRRDDRVARALAYRDAWKCFGVLGV